MLSREESLQRPPPAHGWLLQETGHLMTWPLPPSSGCMWQLPRKSAGSGSQVRGRVTPSTWEPLSPSTREPLSPGAQDHRFLLGCTYRSMMHTSRWALSSPPYVDGFHISLQQEINLYSKKEEEEKQQQQKTEILIIESRESSR